MGAIDPVMRKRVLRVVFISLLLDLISFTFILPLYPALLQYYKDLELKIQYNAESKSNTILFKIINYLNTYKVSFARPIDSRYDVVLLGGALGSLFSFLQAVASPIIGTLSDRYGRRTALLASMSGNLLSVLLWVLATDFRTFLLSRIVGGLSEGNVQLAIAIATDISDEKQRGATLALVGICFSISFTVGPALGAWLSTINLVEANPFATAAIFSLVLIVAETLYLYLCLPETLPSKNSSMRLNNTPKNVQKDISSPPTISRSNSHIRLNFIHFMFILFFFWHGIFTAVYDL